MRLRTNLRKKKTACFNLNARQDWYFDIIVCVFDRLGTTSHEEELNLVLVSCLRGGFIHQLYRSALNLRKLVKLNAIQALFNWCE